MTNTPANAYLQTTQHTLRDSFSCIGVGLHSGLRIIMTVIPAESNTGIRFIRKDIDHGFNEILASWHTVCDTHLNTTVSNRLGVRVSTIEHLLAALYACGIDNALVVLDGPEVPVMDGSSMPFVNMIESVGKRNQNVVRNAIVIKKPVVLNDGKRMVSLNPSPVPTVEIEIEFQSKAIGRQEYTFNISDTNFTNELARARTFGFAEQVTTLKQLGFARGGTLQNAVVVHNNNVLNQGGLRYENEFVRHKALDCIGDLALAGSPIIGHYKARYPGHMMTNLLLHELLRNHQSFEYVSLKELNLDGALNNKVSRLH